jgi:hypothetical protein
VQKLEDFVLTTCFILRLFIFMLLGAQVDFALIGQYWLAGAAIRRRVDAGRASGNGIPVRPPRPPRAGAFARCCSCAGRARPASSRRRWPAFCQA